MLLHLVHARADFLRIGDPTAIQRRGEDDRRIDAMAAIDEFHLGIAERDLLAFARDAMRLAQHILCFAAAAASATRVSSAAVPARTVSPSAATEPKARGDKRMTTPSTPPSRTIRFEPTPTTYTGISLGSLERK